MGTQGKLLAHKGSCGHEGGCGHTSSGLHSIQCMNRGSIMQMDHVSVQRQIHAQGMKANELGELDCIQQVRNGVQV